MLDMEEIKIEAECKNCRHPVKAHSPNCITPVYPPSQGRPCACNALQYYGVLLSDEFLGWTELRCNNCGRHLGYLNTINEDVFKVLENETISCSDCLISKEHRFKEV